MELGQVALYRKYRSQTFADVIGQAHILTSLSQAIMAGRLSHAYLFTGPRGVGKTSVARLVAASVNCVGTDGAAKPCGRCRNCQLEPSANLDVIEIDAASNRRIDEIRDLRDKINLSPAHSQYKVYIIDEVHMLTTEAFNALLKTLEEPPAHVIFVLATTEAHKIPDTIISRTQRFHFHPINETDLIKGLSKIATAEKLQVEPDALKIIATAGRGSFRDAISLLDQVSASGQKVTANTVQELLGWVDQALIDSLSLAVAQGQTKAALEVLDQAYSRGFAASQLIDQMINRWRQYLHHAAGRTSQTPDPAAEAISAEIEPGKIAAILENLVSANRSNWPELVLETLIAKQAKTSSTQAAVTQPPPAAPATKPLATAPLAPITKPSQGSDDQWQKALVLIKDRNNSLYALLRSCTIQLDANQLILGCRFNFHKDRLSEPKNRQIIETALDKTYHRPIQVLIELQQQAPSAPATAATEAELVSSALEILGGEVIDGS